MSIYVSWLSVVKNCVIANKCNHDYFFQNCLIMEASASSIFPPLPPHSYQGEESEQVLGM